MASLASWEEITLIDILEILSNKAPDILKAVLSWPNTIIELSSNNINLKAPEQLCRDFLILLKHLKEACTKGTINFKTILNFAVDDGAKLAHVAAVMGNLEAVKLIASHDTSTLWERTTYGDNLWRFRDEVNALDIAAYNLNMDIIYALLLGYNGEKARPEVLTERMRNGATVLCAAAHSGAVEIIEFLLSQKLITDVNQKSVLRISNMHYSHPPLYFLIINLLTLIRSCKIDEDQYSRYIQCMWLLLRQGACLNYENKSNDTFLDRTAAGISTRSYYIRLLGALRLGGLYQEFENIFTGIAEARYGVFKQATTLIIQRGEERHAALRQQFLGRPALYWAVLTALEQAYADFTDPLAIEIGSYVKGLLQVSKWAHLITQPSKEYLGYHQEMIAQFKICGLPEVPYKNLLYVVGTTWNVKTPAPVEANLAKAIHASMITMHNHLEAVGIQLMQGKEIEGISAHRRWSILDWYGLSPNDRMTSQIIGRQMHQVHVEKANGKSISLPEDIWYVIHDIMFPPSIRGLQFFPRPLINPQQLVNSSEPDAPVRNNFHRLT
jgi:ankyrin repeat protein